MKLLGSYGSVSGIGYGIRLINLHSILKLPFVEFLDLPDSVHRAVMLKSVAMRKGTRLSKKRLAALR
jgi:hypothetical protein